MTEDVMPSSDSVDEPWLVDARDLRCPLPLLRAKQALRKIPVGGCVRVLATDAGSVRDFRAFADIAGHRLHVCEENLGVYTYVLEKGPQLSE